MPRTRSKKAKLRAQIEAAAATRFPVDPIEEQIAHSLRDNGRFEDRLDAQQLAIVLRHVAYTIFAQQTLAGLNVGIVHDVPTMEVEISESQARVHFVVHIHRPIVAFINFKYALVNDPVSVNRKLRVKRGTLEVKEHTRRLDLKAKATLATIHVAGMARKELADLTRIIATTLPPQLRRHGVEGTLRSVELALEDRWLNVSLAGDFKPLSLK